MTDLVAAARAYLGVRFRHRGRGPDRLDCAGLVVAAYKDCGIDLPDFLLYGPEPFMDGLSRHVQAALGLPVQVAPVHSDCLAAGDVVVLRFEQEPHHLGIIGEMDYGGIKAPTLIHADGFSGRVLEQRLSPDIAARITHVHRRAVRLEE